MTHNRYPSYLVIDRVDRKHKHFYGKSSVGDKRRQQHDYSHMEMYPERGQVIEFTGAEPVEMPKGKLWDLEYKEQDYKYPDRIPSECLFDVIEHSSHYYHIGKKRFEPIAKQFSGTPHMFWDLLRLAEKGDVPEALVPLAKRGKLLERLIIGWRIEEWKQRCKHLEIPDRARRRFLDIYKWEAAHRFDQNPFCILAYCEGMNYRSLWRTLAKAFPERQKQAVWAAVWVVFYVEAESYRMSIPQEQLAGKAKELLGKNGDASLLEELIAKEHLVLNRGHYQLRPIHVIEGWIAAHLMRLNRPAEPGRPLGVGKVDWQSVFRGISRADIEHEAVKKQCREFELGRLLLIYGEAGAGKTWLSARLLAACLKAGWALQVVAISNIAVSRVRHALTPHIQEQQGTQPELAYSSVQRFLMGPSREEYPPTIILLDEASMIGSGALLELLGKVRACDRLIMVGDPKQVPPIGWGAVFHMLQKLDGLNRVELKERMRQGGDGAGILDFLDALNDEVAPKGLVEAARGKEANVTVMACKKGALNVLQSFLERRVLKEKKQIPVILTLSRRDADGVNGLCQSLWVKSRPSGSGKRKARIGELMEGEPVINTLNQPELGLWNGSRGVVVVHEKKLMAQFHDLSGYQAILPGMERAYAVTVHRAQGEGHEEVILYLGDNVPAKLLHRGTLYTAITRASRKLIIIANVKQFDAGYRCPNPAESARSVSFYGL